MADTTGISHAEVARAALRWHEALTRSVGALLRVWRHRAGLTQVAVARAADVHDSRISVGEQGARLTSGLVRQVAEACGPVAAPAEEVAWALDALARGGVA